MQPPERPYIEFRKERRVSDIINVTFVFLRDEFRGLLRSVFWIIGPLVVLAAVLTSGETMASWGVMMDPEAWLESGEFQPFGWTYFVGIGLQLVIYGLLYGVFYSYVMLYEEYGPGPYSPREVWDRLMVYAGRYISTILWLLLIVALLALLNVIVCLGTVVFLGLMVWLGPIFMLVFPARFDRGDGFWNAFRRCRELIKGEWAPSFGLLFVMQVLVMVIGTGIAGAVMAGYGLVIALVGTGLLAQILSVLLTVASIVAYTAYVLPAVAFVIHYFNLVEQREGIGLEAQIEAMAGESASDDEPRLAL